MKQTDTKSRGTFQPDSIHPTSSGTVIRPESSITAGLQTLTRVLSTTPNELQPVLEQIVRCLQADHGLIFEIDDHAGLRPVAASGLDPDEVTLPGSHLAVQLGGMVLDTGEAVQTASAGEDDRWSGEPSVAEYNIGPILCAPLVISRKTIGVIYVDRTATQPAFTDTESRALALCADLAALSLDRELSRRREQQRRQYFSAVVGRMPIGMIVLNARGQILTINAAALEVFDLDKAKVRTAEEGDPTRFLDTLPDEEQQRWQSLINFVLTTGNEVCEPRFYLRSRYLEKTLSLRMAALTDLPGVEDGLVMAVEDATEKVTAEQYVILSEKLVARGEMAAQVGHALNNYLSVISNSAELMSLNVGKEKYDKVQFNCRSIIDNVFKIKSFIEGLTERARPEPEYISYDIRHLIDDLLFSLRLRPRFKAVHFTIDLSDQIPYLEMDVGQVQQVLMNLLDNASDAIEERAAWDTIGALAFKRTITIKASFDKKSDTAAISVADNGIGMTDETLSKVFTLHFTTKRGGHGLGLYNCRLIAQQHGGDLKVASVPGEGSSFTLTLPRLQRRIRKPS